MSFTVGETVVYPNHGAAVIEAIEMRTIKGEEREYLVLRIVAQQDLVVRVPACNLDLVGVRDVVDQVGLDKVFSILRGVGSGKPSDHFVVDFDAKSLTQAGSGSLSFN